MKNFRIIDYSYIKHGLLSRGEALHHLSKKDKKMLLDECHLKTVIDLRTRQEHEEKPNKIIPGVNYIHLPIITMEEMGASSEEEGKEKTAKSQQLPDIFDYYRKMVSPDKKEKWSQIFDILLNNNDGGIYFHCTVGKDRTGMVIAIILTALGIDKETIYKDYLLTNEHPIIPFKYKLFALSLKKEVRKGFWEYFKAHKEYLDTAFHFIDITYGNVDNFFKECCSLDEKKIYKLKEIFLK